LLNNPHKNDNIKLITDSYRFRQIFANLLNNAFKYTEEGYIEFGVKKQDDKILCYVKDTGIGIPEEKKHLIFERFTKVDDNKSRIFRGAGVGLTLSKKLANLLGGDLWVDTKEDVGSTFYFNIPYFPHRKEKTVSLSVNWENKKILIPKDENKNYLLLQNI
ncbi:ATP-binding protein, partial [Bacteroidota bacterium]